MGMNIIWGSDALPLHDAQKTTIEYRSIGHARRTLNGKLRYDRHGDKRIITVTWSALTDSEYQTLRQAFLNNAFDATKLVIPEATWPDEDDPTVIAAHNGMQTYTTWVGKEHDIAVYFAQITFEEV